MVRSKLYKELSDSELQIIAKDFCGENVCIAKTKLLKGGLYNTTYLVETAHSKFVLRVGPVNTHLLFEYEKDMMAIEPYFHSLLHENNIPTSIVLKYSPAGSVIDREYIIIDYIDAIPMNDPSLEGTPLDYIYEEVGRLTHKIHAIKSDSFGWKRLDDSKMYSTWSSYIKAFAEECAKKATQHQLYTPQEIALFRKMLLSDETLYLFDEIKESYMVHTDIWQGNVLLRKNNEKYEIAAIIDLDRTVFGDPNLDLSMKWMVNESFLRGYGSDAPSSENDKKREKLYLLLYAFFESYVCLIEYDDHEWYKRTHENTLSLLQGFTV